MENATKALLIAAAILIAIILISMVMGVVTQGQEASQNVDMSELEMTSHNSKFTGYEGSAVSGSRVQMLLNAVITNNQDGKKVSAVEVKYKEKAGATASDYIGVNTTSVPTEPAVQATDRYKVECEMKNGIVKTITITKI